MNDKILAVPPSIWIAFFGTALVFIAIPELDLIVSRLFYTPGLGFRFRGTALERLVYHSVEWLTLWGGLALIGAWLIDRARGRVRFGLAGRDLAVALLVLAIGPGLLVNAILKEHTGRARPVNIIEHGGDRDFTPAFVPSDQGGGSFSSGHAAAAFFWMTVALLARRRRSLWLTMAIAYGVVVGLVRIAAGGHFLSDVLVSFFIVLLVTLILRDHFYPEGLPRASTRPVSANQGPNKAR